MATTDAPGKGTVRRRRIIDLRSLEADETRPSGGGLVGEPRSGGQMLPNLGEAASSSVRRPPSAQTRVWVSLRDGLRTIRWQRRYALALVTFDVLALAAGGAVGTAVRFGSQAAQESRSGLPYPILVALLAPLWVAGLMACRAYSPHFIGVGSEEYRRVGSAALRFTALAALVCVAWRLEPARSVFAVAIVSATVFTLIGRYGARRLLHWRRRYGGAMNRVLVVGDGPSRQLLVDRLVRSSHSGLQVVGVARPLIGEDGGRALAHVVEAARAAGADTVAVAHSPGVTPAGLRRMAWMLEGQGMDLLVAPALTDVAGPRIHVRPVSGLPLLQIAEPELVGARRLMKEIQDRIGAVVLLVLAAPVLLVAAVAVRLSGPGPVIFTQARVGRGGETFTLFKFRSMRSDAEILRQQLLDSNDLGDGHVLFKMRDDPRVTRVGRVLRRYSIDELPQLLNVVLGSMSLVGPRPPLPSEVQRYDGDVQRRLLVKPGITGLWQVSGRSDLDWDETVRLDLYYVENWSPALDAEILWKTIAAVFQGVGAR